jgi:hypothetical protein
VFTARYALSPYIKQIRFVFKGLIQCENIIWRVIFETSRGFPHHVERNAIITTQIQQQPPPLKSFRNHNLLSTTSLRDSVSELHKEPLIKTSENNSLTHIPSHRHTLLPTQRLSDFPFTTLPVTECGANYNINWANAMTGIQTRMRKAPTAREGR